MLAHAGLNPRPTRSARGASWRAINTYGRRRTRQCPEERRPVCASRREMMCASARRGGAAGGHTQLHHRTTQGARRKNRKPLKRNHRPTQHGTSSLEGLLRFPSAKKRAWGGFWILNTKKGQAFGENNYKSSRSCTPQSLLFSFENHAETATLQPPGSKGEVMTPASG
jgi:hypothetical protein